ncbi:CDC27 family protein [Clostridium sp. ATCC 25772]|uniref:tetratricopeptide repeat protein n=1 Tax=Clostridium sp. ATCC 25772 TaxID=1676991 RepID=UPI0007832803|nr:CDC27 family protein [Clostridium sp. ATCC 25772]
MKYFEKANDLYNKKQYEHAINFYKKSIETKENEAASLYNTAVCFIKLKEFDKAIINLHNALNIKKESSYFFNLGYCYAMINEKNKALNYFNIAWSLNPKDTECEKAINLILKSYLHKASS